MSLNKMLVEITIIFHAEKFKKVNIKTKNIEIKNCERKTFIQSFLLLPIKKLYIIKLLY